MKKEYELYRFAETAHLFSRRDMSFEAPKNQNYAATVISTKDFGPRHGADVEIDITRHTLSFTTESGKIFKHMDKQGRISQPSVRSYKEGVRIGCTFITGEALEKLAELHKKFLTDPGFRIHQ